MIPQLQTILAVCLFSVNMQSSAAQNVSVDLPCSPAVQTLTSRSGTLSSPKVRSHFTNTCQWRISAPSDSEAVNLSFIEMLTRSYNYEFLKIYNGFDSTAPLLASFSGGSYAIGGYSTTQRHMYITFTSTGASAFPLFSASYSTIELSKISLDPLAFSLTAVALAAVLSALIPCCVICIYRRRQNRPNSRSRTSSVEPEPVVAPSPDGLSNANDPISFIIPPPSYDSAVNAGVGPSPAPVSEYTAVQFISKYQAGSNRATNVYDNPQPLQPSHPLLASASNSSPTPSPAPPLPSYADTVNSAP